MQPAVATVNGAAPRRGRIKTAPPPEPSNNAAVRVENPRRDTVAGRC
jgi:hypothetical protein